MWRPLTERMVPTKTVLLQYYLPGDKKKFLNYVWHQGAYSNVEHKYTLPYS